MQTEKLTSPRAKSYSHCELLSYLGACRGLRFWAIFGAVLRLFTNFYSALWFYFLCLGLIFTGIKFRGDLISRAKWPRNPRNFIFAKILKMGFREIKSPRKLETKPIFEKSLKITQNGIQNIEISENFWKIREIKYPRKLWSLKIRETKSPRKLENVKSAKSAKFNPREN